MRGARIWLEREHRIVANDVGNFHGYCTESATSLDNAVPVTNPAVFMHVGEEAVLGLLIATKRHEFGDAR